MKLEVKWNESRGQAFLNPFQIQAIKKMAVENRVLVLDFLADARFEVESLYEEILKRGAGEEAVPSGALCQSVEQHRHETAPNSGQDGE